MIEIHTLRWRGDRAVATDDDRTDGHLPEDVTVYCRVFVDGKELPNVVRARTMHRNDFVTTVITLAAETEIVNHTQETWDALDEVKRDARDSGKPTGSPVIVGGAQLQVYCHGEPRRALYVGAGWAVCLCGCGRQFRWIEPAGFKHPTEGVR